MKNINLGIIGLGARGADLLKNTILGFDKVNVVSVCDTYIDRAEDAAKEVKKKRGTEPAIETEYIKVIENKEVNTIVIAAAWEAHVDIAVEAMYAGKAVALEVGGAYNIEECWKLVDAYEETKTPFMFLENCCFGKSELLALNMVKQGLFGEIVHCFGCYGHDIREEVAHGVEKRHYRLRNYISRNCENYPTHDLGPIARILDINHGNRLVSLTSTASKAAGLKEYIKTHKSDDKELMNTEFKQGDIVTTVIKCARGETIVLQLDTTLPRYTDRNLIVRGTKGMYEELNEWVFLNGDNETNWRKAQPFNSAKYAKKYEHPIWKKFLKEGVHGTHGGMDYLEFECFFKCLKKDLPMPVDVYDAATWMAITALSEQSIANGSTAVEIPDFTRGKWLEETEDTREPIYCPKK